MIVVSYSLCDHLDCRSQVNETEKKENPTVREDTSQMKKREDVEDMGMELALSIIRGRWISGRLSARSLDR
jgi:hypothetical protein